MSTRTAYTRSTLLQLGCAIAATATAWLSPALLPVPIAALLVLGLVALAWDSLTAVWVVYGAVRPGRT
jgi:hypothetical protein